MIFPSPFGRYVLVGELGAGGMGKVYQARDSFLNRSVALKRIRTDTLAGADALRRFRVEAEAVASLDHPHIVPLYEVGEQEGELFFAMKLVPGGTLAEEIAGQPLPPRQAAALLAQIARAVAHAHQRGVLHRDLKPGNILLDDDGTPYLADFGLAKLRDTPNASTASHAALGTPAYMAPEVAVVGACAATTRSDIYGFGAVLFHALTGQPPYTGDSPLAVLERVRKHPVREPRALQPGLPRDLELICLKCLRPLPQDRYSAAEEVADDLERWLRGEPVRAREPSLTELLRLRLRQHRVAAATAGAVALSLMVGLGLAFWQWQRAETALVQVRSQFRDAQLQLAQQAADRGRLPEGVRTLARLVREEPTNQAASDRLLAFLSQRQFLWPHGNPLQHTSEVGRVLFSPDGRFVVTVSTDRSAGVWNARTGQRMPASLKHDDALTTAAFSPRGDRLATASKDGTAKVWTFPAGELIATIRYTNSVESVAFSPDDARLATGSEAGTARLSDAATGGLLVELRGGFGPLTHVAFSADGRWLVTCGEGARLWDAHTGAGLRGPLRHGGKVAMAAFSPQSDRLVTASEDHSARLWQAATGAPLGELMRHEGPVLFVAFSPDGARVATASEDGTARVWNATNGLPLTPPLRHKGTVFSARFNAEGTRLITASGDNTARIWDVATGQPWCEPVRQGFYVFDAAFSPDGQQVVTACGAGYAQLWSVTPVPPLARSLPPGGHVRMAVFDPSGTRVASAGSDNTVHVVDAMTLHEVTPPMTNTRPCNVVRLSADGARLLSASEDGTACLWNSYSGQRLGAPLKHDEAVLDARFSADARRIVTATPSKVRLWDGDPDLNSRQPLLTWSNAANGQVRSIDFAKDGQTVVIGCDNGQLWTWDVAQVGQARLLLQHDAPIWCCRLSPEGTRVATASFDRTSLIVDLRTGRQVTSAMEHDGEAWSVSWSRDGRKVATASTDMTARLWDAATGESLTPPLEHEDKVFRAEFSPDGRRLATASLDGTARIWDVRTGLPLCDPLRHRMYPNRVEFSPDGQRLLTVSNDGADWLWELPAPVEPAPDWLPALAEALAAQGSPTPGSQAVAATNLPALLNGLARLPGTNTYERWARAWAASRLGQPSAP